LISQNFELFINVKKNPAITEKCLIRKNSNFLKNKKKTPAITEKTSVSAGFLKIVSFSSG